MIENEEMFILCPPAFASLAVPLLSSLFYLKTSQSTSLVNEVPKERSVGTVLSAFKVLSNTKEKWKPLTFS